VLLSLIYRSLRCLFGLLAVLIRSDLSKDIEPLVLLVGRRRWPEVFPVTPATIQRIPPAA
jgi:putative transposase